MAQITFNTTIQKFSKNGDKTNWTYIIIPAVLATTLNPGVKKSFRVTGSLDKHKISKVALMPVREGNFMLAINASMRKALKKNAGSSLVVNIATDHEPPPINKDLIRCLKDEPAAYQNFNKLVRSHQLYFSNWVSTAKTIETRDTRIVHCVDALLKNHDFGFMIRSLKKDKL